MDGSPLSSIYSLQLRPGGFLALIGRSRWSRQLWGSTAGGLVSDRWSQVDGRSARNQTNTGIWLKNNSRTNWTKSAGVGRLLIPHTLSVRCSRSRSGSAGWHEVGRRWRKSIFYFGTDTEEEHKFTFFNLHRSKFICYSDFPRHQTCGCTSDLTAGADQLTSGGTSSPWTVSDEWHETFKHLKRDIQHSGETLPPSARAHLGRGPK